MIFLRQHWVICERLLGNRILEFIAILLFICLYIVDIMLIYNKSAYNHLFSHLYLFLPQSLIAMFALFFCCKQIPIRLNMLLFVGQNTLLYLLFHNRVLAIMTYICDMFGLSELFQSLSVIKPIIVIFFLLFLYW